MTNNDKALGAFLGEMALAEEKLLALTIHLEDHCCTHPDCVNWGHAGDLQRLNNILNDALLAVGLKTQ